MQLFFIGDKRITPTSVYSLYRNFIFMFIFSEYLDINLCIRGFNRSNLYTYLYAKTFTRAESGSPKHSH